MTGGVPALWLLLSACDVAYTDPTREFADPFDTSRTYPTEIDEPPRVAVWDAPLTADGPELAMRPACVTCHGQTPDESWKPAPGENFHTSIELEHGTLVCNQCHDRDRTVLHLADGTPVPFNDVIRLCAQCHGPQWRDYQHGAHGGMNGYWDTHQGPRTRNNCVDCHTPHDPAFKKVMPVFPPRDRHLHDPAPGGE